MNPEWEELAKRELTESFPKLAGQALRITSDPNHRYNCVAWAFDDTVRKWWPVPASDSSLYWPEGIPRKLDLPSFELLLEKVGGYSPCEGTELEEDDEKIAIFATSDGCPKHVAKQLPSGEWTSKMGQDLDIAHGKLAALEGEMYGRVVRVMHRPRRHTPEVRRENSKS